MAGPVCNSKYDQDCTMGVGTVMTVFATLAYFVAQMLVCCTPRPDPFFNLCKKKTVKRKKKKKKKNRDSSRNLNSDSEYDGESFRDEDSNYVDPYHEDGGNSYYDDNYDGEAPSSTRSGLGTVDDSDYEQGDSFQSYDSNYDDGTYGQDTYGQDSYAGYDNGAYDNGAYETGNYDDGNYDDGNYGDYGDSYAGDNSQQDWNAGGNYTNSEGQYS